MLEKEISSTWTLYTYGVPIVGWCMWFEFPPLNKIAMQLEIIKRTYNLDKGIWMIFSGPKFMQLRHTELGLSSAGGQGVTQERQWLGQVTELGLSTKGKPWRQSNKTETKLCDPCVEKGKQT